MFCSLFHYYCRRCVFQLVSDVETTLLAALSTCQSSVDCELAVVRSVGNARLAGTVDTLVQLAVSSSHSAVAEAALSSLTRFDADDILRSAHVSDVTVVVTSASHLSLICLVKYANYQAGC